MRLTDLLGSSGSLADRIDEEKTTQSNLSKRKTDLQDKLATMQERYTAQYAALDALLQETKAQEPQPELHIKAQGKAKYEAVAGVLASAQRQGLTKIGIVGTEQFAAP